MTLAPPVRTLVTGGAGFLGTHLCRRLLDLGHEVLCLDNFYSSSRGGIADMLSHPRFELLRHDITFPVYVEVDEIFNLACPASPIHYQYDPVHTTKTCVHGAINVLGLAKRLGAPIFQASTSEVYGSPREHPQSETYWGNTNPIGPRSCYVDDMIHTFVLYMSSREPVAGPLNLGNPTEITVRELAERIIEVTGSSSTLISKPLPADDPVRRCPDIALAEKLLDWKPTTELETGLRRTVEYFDALLSMRSEN